MLPRCIRVIGRIRICITVRLIGWPPQARTRRSHDFPFNRISLAAGFCRRRRGRLDIRTSPHAAVYDDLHYSATTLSPSPGQRVEREDKRLRCCCRWRSSLIASLGETLTASNPTAAKQSIQADLMEGGAWTAARGFGDPLRSILRSISSAQSSSSLRRRKVSDTYGFFRRTWTRQFPEGNCVKLATAVCTPQFVCATCALRGQNRYKRVQIRLVWSAHVHASSY